LFGPLELQCDIIPDVHVFDAITTPHAVVRRVTAAAQLVGKFERAVRLVLAADLDAAAVRRPNRRALAGHPDNFEGFHDPTRPADVEPIARKRVHPLAVPLLFLMLLGASDVQHKTLERDAAAIDGDDPPAEGRVRVHGAGRRQRRSGGHRPEGRRDDLRRSRARE
jgi:hypothetical protein